MLNLCGELAALQTLRLRHIRKQVLDAIEHQREPLFAPNKEMLSMSKKDWEELTEETFKTVFKNSPIKRTKFEGIKRNIDFLKDGLKIQMMNLK